MSATSEFEDFLAGEGPLAQALRALEPFEPPARMEADFLTMLATLPEGAPAFEPPARLQQNVFAEIALQQAAQQSRRDAVLQDLSRGRPASEALGAPVAAGTEAWLRQQAAAASSQTAPAPRKPRPWWFFAAGGAVAAMLAVGVSLHLMLERPELLESARPNAGIAAQVSSQKVDESQERLRDVPPAAAAVVREDAPMAKVVPAQAPLAARKQAVPTTEARRQAPAGIASPAPASPPAELGRAQAEPPQPLSAEADAPEARLLAAPEKLAAAPTPAAKPAPSANEETEVRDAISDHPVGSTSMAARAPVATTAEKGDLAGLADTGDKDVTFVPQHWALTDDPSARLASLPPGRRWVLQCHPTNEAAAREWLRQGMAETRLNIRVEMSETVAVGELIVLEAGQ